MTALERALTLAHSVGDMETVAHAEHVSGHVEHALGNEHEARERFAAQHRTVPGARDAVGHRQRA